MVVDEAHQLAHNLLIRALHLPQTALILIYRKLLQPIVHLHTLLHLCLRQYFIPVGDVGQLLGADDGALEVRWSLLVVAYDNLHGWPDKFVEGE